MTAPVAAGVEDFVPYVAVPYVSGESLDAAIRQYGPAPAGDAIRLIGHVAEALDDAAHLGVFHGSLHPRDILVTPGETHVTGFGVAQALERVGLHGPVRRPYVAPEREGGDEWGAAADIYSLAAIAYEVLTGRRALPGTDQPLPALADLRVHDAAALREAIETALDPDPARRPAHARDFAAAFAAALSEAAVPGAAGDRAAERRSRKPRARAPKLPGLDEPLQAPESAAKGRPRTGRARCAWLSGSARRLRAPAAATRNPRSTEPAAIRPPTRRSLRRSSRQGLACWPARRPTCAWPTRCRLGETRRVRRWTPNWPPPSIAWRSDRGAGSSPTPLGIDIFGPGPAAMSVSDEVLGADARAESGRGDPAGAPVRSPPWIRWLRWRMPPGRL